MLEAILLVLVVTAALAVTTNQSGVELALPGAEDLQLRPGPALVVAALAGVVMMLLHLHAARLAAGLSAGVLRSARSRAVDAFVNATTARQADVREGALQEAVSTLATQTSSLVMFLTSFGAAVIGLGALLAAALIVDLVVTVIVLCFGAVLVLALRPIGHLTNRRARDFVARNSRFTEQAGQWSALATELRVFGVEHVQRQRLEDENAGAADAMARSRFVSRAGGEVYRDLAILFLVGAVGVLHVAGQVDVATVGAVVLLIVRSLSYAQMTNTALQSLNEYGPNLDELVERLGSLERAAQTFGGRKVEVLAEVDLCGVGYDYEPGRIGIDGVSLTIAPGEAIGVVGPSGGGKSTLVQVLLRLRPPTRGVLSVAGVPYQEIDGASWHRLVTVVPQEPQLFQGSVAENIAFLRDWIDRASLERAAEDAHVLDDILRLPHGFDTQLGPRGAGLSGGQKQRIAIARALAGNPQLLVLDEPTSALDIRSEQLLQRTIEDLKGRVTLVIVAHRLTTLACCDRVVALEVGSVKAIGTLDEALAHVSLAEALGRSEVSELDEPVEELP